MQTFFPKGQISGVTIPWFALKDYSLTNSSKLLYGYMCSLASIHNRDYCYPSFKALAEFLGCCPTSAKGYMRELEAAGLIQIRRTCGHTSFYYLLSPKSTSAGESTALAIEKHGGDVLSKAESYEMSRPDTPCKNLPGGEADFASQYTKEKYINTKNPLTPRQGCLFTSCADDVSDSMGGIFSEFETVWALYPKKSSEASARFAWGKLRKNDRLPPLEEHLAAVRHFAASDRWQVENGRFIPQFKNWLYGEYWKQIPNLKAETENHAAQVEVVEKYKEQTAASEARSKSITDQLRPYFDTFAAQFDNKPFHRPLVYGRWLSLYRKNMAPVAADVPPDNTLDIMSFLEAFQRERSLAAYAASHVVKNVLRELGEATTAQSAPQLFSSHVPLPSGDIFKPEKNIPDLHGQPPFTPGSQTVIAPMRAA